MKKLLFLLLIGLFSGVLIAQNNVQPVHNKGSEALRINKITNDGGVKSTTSSPKSSVSRWYNYGETMELFQGVPSSLNVNYLFPDSTILVSYTTGYGSPWIHKLGDVLDVTSVMFNDPNLYPTALKMDAMTDYKVDSVYLHCLYRRSITDTNIVDTMLFEISINDNLPQAYFAPGVLSPDLSTDTIYMKRLPYAYLTNSLNLSNKKIYKVPLNAHTCNDTLSNGVHVIKLSTANLPKVNPGKKVVVSAMFKPGYTWVANTDIIDNKNSLFFVSRRELDNQFPHYTKGDFNISYIIPNDVRYNFAGSWNGNYIPSYAYMGGTSSTYNFEHHLIYYKISTAFNISSSYQDVTCHSGTDGQINLVVSGGTPPYVYTWSNGASTPDLSELGAGTYTVTITDHDSTSTVRIFTIKQPPALQATVSSTPTSACGTSDGSITVSGIQGGTPSYSVVVLNSDSVTQALTGLPAGVYTVKITDANGCKLINHVEINEQGAPTCSVVQNNISCHGLIDGSINITVNNPSGTPTFIWSNGHTTASISGLSQGTYSVTITDNNCHIYKSFVIIEPELIQVNGTVTNATGGLSNGSIIIHATGGTPPYTYLWSSGQQTQNIGALSDGSYTVTVTDSKLCTKVVTYQVISVGINDCNFEHAVTIFPNPANDVINFSFRGINGKDVAINIYSIQGKLLKSQHVLVQNDNDFSMEIHNFAQGLYFAEIVIDGYRLTRKFVKK